MWESHAQPPGLQGACPPELQTAMRAADSASRGCGNGCVPLAAKQVAPGLWCVLLSDTNRSSQEVGVVENRGLKMFVGFCWGLGWIIWRFSVCWVLGSWNLRALTLERLRRTYFAQWKPWNLSEPPEASRFSSFISSLRCRSLTGAPGSVTWAPDGCGGWSAGRATETRLTKVESIEAAAPCICAKMLRQIHHERYCTTWKEAHMVFACFG